MPPHLITEAAERLSKADLPTEIADALAMGAMTALMKDNGRIRDIVTGGTFRWGVASSATSCATPGGNVAKKTRNVIREYEFRVR